MPSDPRPRLTRRKAYYVTEAIKGTQQWLVHADSAADARERFKAGEAYEAIDNRIFPNGIREVRRAPDEDEFA